MTATEEDTAVLTVTELVNMALVEARSETEFNAAIVRIMDEAVQRYPDFPSHLLFYCIGRGVGLLEARWKAI